MHFEALRVVLLRVFVLLGVLISQNRLFKGLPYNDLSRIYNVVSQVTDVIRCYLIEELILCVTNIEYKISFL